MVLNLFADKARYATLRKHGEKLMRELLHPENGFGGHLTLITGPIGSGKTSIMLSLAKVFAKAGYIVIFRGREAFELYRLPRWKEWTRLYTPKDHVIHFVEHDGTTKELQFQTIEYADIKNLLEKVKPGKINVVYASKKINEKWLKEHVNPDLIKESIAHRETIFWIELFDQALKKLAGRKVVIIIDEAHELFPGGNSGLLWHLIDIAKSKIADFRKYKLNLVLSTHDPSDLDWRINRKFDYAIYLRGAKTLKRIVWQKYTYKLDEDAAFIESPAEFGLIKFKKLKETRVILVHWRATKPRAKWEEREKQHLKAIKEVAEENGGLFQRRWVRERMGRLFNKDAYLRVVKKLKENGKVKEVGRGVYSLVEKK